jgi:LIM domain-binding protein 1
MLQESDNLWWDAFATEFFEDEATLTLTFCLEDGPKRYSKYTFIININLRIFYHIIWGIVLSELSL